MKKKIADRSDIKPPSIQDLRRSVAIAAAAIVEGNLQMMEEMGRNFSSPIEEKLFLGLSAAAQRANLNVDMYGHGDGEARWELNPSDVFPSCRDEGFERPMHVGYTWSASETSIRIYPQVKVGTYRVDFLVTFGVWQASPGGVVHRAVVECDGHDFHERTKEQARHDRKRDRVLQEAGLPVLRFTGSEIHADAIGCGLQIMRFLDSAFLNGRGALIPHQEVM